MTFRLRITLGMIVVIAILFSIGGTALISASFNVSVRKEEQAAVENMNLTLRMLQMLGENKSSFTEEDLTGTVRQIAERGMFDAVMLENEEKVLLNAGSTYLLPANRSLEKTASYFSGIPSGEIRVMYTSAEEGHPALLAASALAIGDNTYVLRSARDLDPIYHVRSQQQSVFSRIYIILIAVSALLSYFAATVLTRSLRKLGKASREIASGNLSYRSNIRTEDEIGELSRDFDHMADSLEENMRRIREEADRKERFMGAFTHELKTPMTSIIGYADLLRTQELSPEEQADALNYIFAEGKRLENMSLKLLDLFVADKEKVELRRISPEKLLEDLVDHLTPAFQKAGISIDLLSGKGTCMLEPDLFRTLIINLLDNARKAMKDGGNITVTAFPEGEMWHFTVRDNGKGMAEEEIAHITEAFYRIDKARARSEGSAGLGLALCDKIVQLHHGTMHFESRIGEGTTVHIQLPGNGENNEESRGES